MSAPQEKLLGFINNAPLKRFVEKQGLEIEEELREREPGIKERILTNEKIIDSLQKDSIPEIISVLEAQRTERDEILLIYQAQLAKVDREIKIVEDEIERSVDKKNIDVDALLRSLKQKKLQILQTKEQLQASLAEKLKSSDAAINYLEGMLKKADGTVKLCTETIKADKEKLEKLRAKRNICYRQLCYFTAEQSSETGSLNSPSSTRNAHRRP